MDRTIAKYSWDTDFNKLDSKRDKKYIIERILETGDESAVHELFSIYSTGEIREALRENRHLSPKSADY